jgi:Na+-translocating ferredoxin:NAD+ oxidoreductase RNF subunit RnfB
MDTEQPQPASRDTGKDAFEFMRGDEYSELAETIGFFDDSRKMAYMHIVSVMQGEGGDTQYEAFEKLEEMVEQTSKNFSALAVSILQEHDGDEKTAIAAIANIYLTDENQRVDILQPLEADTEYQKTVANDLIVALYAIVKQSDDAKEMAENLEHIYGRSLNTDFNTCLEAAPENNHELQTQKREKMRARVTTAAMEIGKLAAGGLITAVIVSKFSKR